MHGTCINTNDKKISPGLNLVMEGKKAGLYLPLPLPSLWITRHP